MSNNYLIDTFYRRRCDIDLIIRKNNYPLYNISFVDLSNLSPIDDKYLSIKLNSFAHFILTMELFVTDLLLDNVQDVLKIYHWTEAENAFGHDERQRILRKNSWSCHLYFCILSQSLKQ